MTQRLFSIALLLAVISTAACEHPQSPVPKNESAAIQGDCGQALDTAYRVLCPLTTARQYTHSYDSICHHIHGNDDLTIHAYTIRAVDLLAAMGLPPTLADSSICRFKHIRVYMGYENKVGFKLFIVPVDGACLKGKDSSMWAAGNDVLLDKYARPILAPDSSSNGMVTTDTYVLDLNAPCPNTCPSGIQRLLTGK